MILEHLILFGLYTLGVAYHVMQKIGKIRALFPDMHANEVFKTFFKEEWNTLIVSALGLVTVQLFWFIANYKNILLPGWLHGWGIYVIALVCGYALQRLIYKFLGTTESVLNKRIESLNK